MCIRWGRDGRGEGLRRATRREEERRTCWIYSWNGSVTEVVWHTRASCRNGPPAWRPGRWSWGDARAVPVLRSLHRLDPFTRSPPGCRGESVSSNVPPPHTQCSSLPVPIIRRNALRDPHPRSQRSSASSERARLPHPAPRLSTPRFRTNALARSLAASAPAPGAPLSLRPRMTLARRTIRPCTALVRARRARGAS